MEFGLCGGVGQGPAAKTAGFDFLEENVQGLLQGNAPAADWQGAARAKSAELPILAANMLVPAALKITGPTANLDALRKYMAIVLERAAAVGIKILVFGSGGARQVPDGFDRDTARRQILEFAKMSAPLAQQHGVMLVAEPLNRTECNIINTVPEAMDYVRAVNHPNFQCLVDSYHFWLEKEPLAPLREAMPWIKHVHLADVVGRVAPGESPKPDDYRPFFGVLKDGGYQGMISVEAMGFSDIAGVGPRVVRLLRRQWSEA